MKMRFNNRWIALGLILVASQYISCTTGTPGPPPPPPPAVVEHIAGSEVSRVTLTEKAIERIALETEKVREAKVSRYSSARKVIPYSALIYDSKGQTWVYTSPEPRAFVRSMVDVDYIEGDIAVLKSGPAIGTVVASVAVAELYGAEFGVGH